MEVSVLALKLESMRGFDHRSRCEICRGSLQRMRGLTERFSVARVDGAPHSSHPGGRVTEKQTHQLCEQLRVVTQPRTDEPLVERGLASRDWRNWDRRRNRPLRCGGRHQLGDDAGQLDAVNRLRDVPVHAGREVPFAVAVHGVRR